MSKKKYKEKKNKLKTKKRTAYAFVGLWHDGTPGWMMPEYLSGNRHSPSRSYGHEKLAKEHPETYLDDPLVLVKVTLEIVKDKNGRPIMRRPKTR